MKFKRGQVKSVSRMFGTELARNKCSFLFFHPLAFWTCIKKKEGFSVPTNHLWISPQYSFNPPLDFLLSLPYSSFFALCLPVSPIRSPWWWGPCDGCPQCLPDPTLFSFHLCLFILTLVGLCTIHPQIQSPSFCVPWRQGGMEEQKRLEEVVLPFKIRVTGLGSWRFHMQQGRVTLTTG